MPFISVVFTLYSPQLYQSLANHTHAPSTSFLFPFLNNPLSPISTSHGYEFSPWSMVNILGATTLKKIDLPLRTMSCQELGMGPYELSCTHTAILIGSILCRLCAGHHNCCEFMGTVVLSTVLRQVPQPLTAAVLMLLPSRVLWPFGWRCKI